MESGAAIRYVIAAIAALILSSCVPNSGTEGSVAKEGLILPATEETCLARNGTWEQRAPHPFSECMIPHSDFRKACTDASQCEGFCMVPSSVPDAPEPGTKLVGMCTGNTPWRGCFVPVNDGKAKHALCFD